MSFDTGVYRQDPEHIYYNKKGVALRSVSAALALVSEPVLLLSITFVAVPEQLSDFVL